MSLNEIKNFQTVLE